ncbi:MAG: aspartate--tRNA ligase [Candidatus Omnitrophota bacterium]|nr:MAG: aspartate--tRNA ligase [Candidatus Omnitrophota bacterium]
MLRTHTCGQLTKDDIGKEVTLCGWVNARRDHGKVFFIDLRDRYGITQVVFLPKPYKEAYESGKLLRSEFVVKIKGEVNQRPKGTINPKIPTGFVEVLAKEVGILSPSEELPFPLEEQIEVGEEVRLTHRYLDLRRRTVLDKLILRHKFNQAFRSFLNQKEFLEVETPFLTKSTPEGARDYLVPSRLNPTKFYALPQSPQLFKQILMVSGLDKYYQIVRCFRDEDLRKDRQPEFTQLDLEMSFVEEEDILGLVEELVVFTFKEVLNKEIARPFKRISYAEAMKKYSSDKPDLKEIDPKCAKDEFRFLWVVDFPMFEYNEEEKRWQALHHPFTSPKEEDIYNLEKKDLTHIQARAYDLVLNGEEIGSGSVRINTIDLQKKIFKVLGISDEDAEKKFGFLLRSFKYGAPPHAGVAFGLDRLYAIISGSESIREVIAFPKTQRGISPLSGAPSYVDQKQLGELYIKAIEPEKD